MRPTCLFADKNFSTETNLPRCRCPVLMQDFLRTTNILCFSFNQIVNQFSESWINHLFTFHSSLRISSVLLSRLVTNPGFQSNFPFWDNGSPSYEDQSRYRPGQLFWNRNHNDDMQPFAHNPSFAISDGMAVGLVPFWYVQPGVSQPSFAQPSSSGSASVPPPSTTTSPPESIEEEPVGSKTGRSYGKWGEQ